jgi:hypothetical protein
MLSFLNLHAIAAKRGDGLRPELHALFERHATTPQREMTVRSDGMVQSGPDPIFADTEFSRTTGRAPDSASAIAHCKLVVSGQPESR